MSNFNHLTKLDVKKGSTSTLTLFAIEGDPILTLSPATEANNTYFNQVLKRSRKFASAVQAGAISTEMLDETRSLDRELYPVEVIKGWERVYDTDGKLVKFSPSECKDFVKALPNWIFDEIRQFAAKPGNFVEQMDVETAEKN